MKPENFLIENIDFRLVEAEQDNLSSDCGVLANKMCHRERSCIPSEDSFKVSSESWSINSEEIKAISLYVTLNIVKCFFKKS